jgi:hypothetical protein
MRRFWGWFKTHADVIQAIAAIAGVIGLAITVWQLVDTTRTLRAANTYEIQRDAREIIDKIRERGHIAKLIDGTLPETDRDDAATDAWKMFNFYLAVFRQAKAGGVSADFKNAFEHDFCQTISLSPLSQIWDELRRRNQLSSAHDEMRAEWCDETE